MQDLKEQIKNLPHLPGIYKYFDAKGKLLYIGKAKNLHKRVAQYFVSKEKLSLKTKILVGKIANIEYTIVSSEQEALLLENNLIKEFKPPYNILLKDSKTYPWLCVTNDNHPKVLLTRKLELGKGRYFGPYSSVNYAREILTFLKENFPLRSCNFNINPESIAKGKFRPCLDYHIGLCRGNCIGAVSEEDYNKYIEEIVAILKGDLDKVLLYYKEQMLMASENLDFERAMKYKEILTKLESHYAKSVVVSARDRNVDVFSLLVEANRAYCNFLRIKSGAIIHSWDLALKMQIEEEPASLLSNFIIEVKNRFGRLSREALVNFLPDTQIEGVNFVIPKKGDKKALLDLSEKNAKERLLKVMKRLSMGVE